MQESFRAEQWLYSVLSGDAALAALVGTRIYGYVAPTGSASPFVIYSHQGSHDVRGVGAVRILNSMVYQVKGVGQGSSMSAVKAIADRIDALLHATSGTTDDGRILSCVREQTISYVEIDPSGMRWDHCGGLYRLQVQSK